MSWTTNASPHPPSPTGASTYGRAARYIASANAIDGLRLESRTQHRASTPLLLSHRPHHFQHHGRAVALSPAFLDLLLAQPANTAQQDIRRQRVAQTFPLGHFDE